MKPMALLNLLLRFGLGGMLLYAGQSKFQEPNLFAMAIARYQLFPPQVNQFLAIVLPWMEFVTGTMLCLGIWIRPSAIASSIIMIGFAIGASQALARGLDISCGCFGSNSDTQLTYGTLLLQSAAIISGVVLYYSTPSESQTSTESPTPTS